MVHVWVAATVKQLVDCIVSEIIFLRIVLYFILVDINLLIFRLTSLSRMINDRIIL